MYIKALTIDKLNLLSDLFDYNNVEDMIKSNKEKILNGDIDIFCLFDDDSNILGELRVMYDNKDNSFAKKGTRAYLYAFRIQKNYQNKGYGKYILNNVISILKDKGYLEFTVGVEDGNYAKNIYKKSGFTKYIKSVDEEYQGDKYTYNLYLKD